MSLSLSLSFFLSLSLYCIFVFVFCRCDCRRSLYLSYLHIMYFKKKRFLGDDKNDVLEFIQRLHAATDPVIVLRNGRCIFGVESLSRKGNSNVEL